MKKFVLTLAAAAAFFAVQAQAETAVEDTDGNGTYSMDEMAAVYADLSEDLFAQIDADASGEVSPEELAAAVESGLIEG